MEINQTSPLRVQLLNGCRFGVEGKTLLNAHKRPTKGERLLAKLVLMRGEMAPMEELLEIAGLEQDDERSLQSLKVHIHRLRKRLSEMDPELERYIVTLRRGYAWNLERSKVDLFEAERLCKRILATTRMSALKLEDVEDLARLFDKKLLPAFSEEGWVEQEAISFQLLYFEAMSRVMTMMWQTEEYDLIIRTCHFGMIYAPYERMFWENLMRAMSNIEHSGQDVEISRKDWAMIDRYAQSGQGRNAKVMEIGDGVVGKRWALR